MELSSTPAEAAPSAAPEASSPPPSVAPTPSLSFGELLAGMKKLEELVDLPDEAFDPAALLGTLTLKDATEEQIAALRAKIDSVEYVVREFDDYAARTAARAAKIQRRADSAERKAERLRAYVLFQMQTLKFDFVAGNEMVVKLRTHHTPRAIPNAPATAADYGKHPTLVKMIPREYQWDTRALVDVWKNAGKPKPEGVERQVKIDGVDATFEFSQKAVFDERDVPNVTPKKKRGRT
jgi:hypothetical protein